MGARRFVGTRKVGIASVAVGMALPSPDGYCVLAPDPSGAFIEGYCPYEFYI